VLADIGLAYLDGTAKIVVVMVALDVFIASSAIGVGGTGWLIQDESFPTAVRGQATAIAATADLRPRATRPRRSPGCSSTPAWQATPASGLNGTPEHGRQGMDLKFLRPLYRETGGWLSVYLDTGRQPTDLSDLVPLRWRTAREQLTEAGADAVTLDALEAVFTDPSLPAPGRAAFARAGEVVLSRAMRIEPERPLTDVGALPEVMPFLVQYQPPVPRVQVSAARGGGSVLPVYGDSDGHGGRSGPGGLSGLPQPRPEQVGQVKSVQSPWPVHKPSSGGWSKPNYDRSVEHSWVEEAKNLAQLVQQAVSEVNAEYIVVAGDVRARSLLLDQLPASLVGSVVIVDAEIAADSPELAAAADSVIAERTARQDAGQLGEWRRLNAHGRAVEGLPAVVQALREGRAAEVFVARQPLPGAPADGEVAGGTGGRPGEVGAFAGPGGTDLALNADDLRQQGVAEPAGTHATEAIIRAAASADCELRFLPAASAYPLPADRICASLR
jgi:Bacterial archaeo-eukaryotic release factor family 2/Sugar (and other) transporter